MRACGALLLLVTGACAGGNDSARSDAVVTDSAGIRIVHNSIEGVAEWTVSAEPRVVIGVVSGEPQYQFDRIIGIERLSDGSWVVADMGSSEVRFYDAHGGHVRSVGGQGEGPGEFTQILAMIRLAGDTLAIDDGFMRIQLIDGSSGTFLGTVPSEGDGMLTTRLVPKGAFADGTVVGTRWPAWPQRITEPQTIMVPLLTIRSARETGTTYAVQVIDSIGTWPYARLVPGWRNGAIAIEFDVPVLSQVMSDGIAVADPRRYEVMLYDRTGQLHSIIRRDWTPVPVTQEDIETRRARYIDMPGEGGAPVSPALRQQRIDITGQWTFAEHMPAFAGMHIGTDDSIWLRDYVPNAETVGLWRPVQVQPTRWWVYDRDGYLRGTVELPARFRPDVFGEDFVAGQYYDENEVEFVHVYEIRRN